jgi:rod shape-determining protein MreC
MNKGLFSFLILFLVLLLGALNYSSQIQEPFINLLNTIKCSYHYSLENLSQKIDKHFLQAQKITELQSALKKYETNELKMQKLTNDIKNLLVESNSTLKIDTKIELVRAISYEKFGNFNRVWMDIPDYNKSKIYGLTSKGLIAGIVVPKDNLPLAILNKDIKSTYAVLVGKENAPGIAHGNNSKNIIIKFIPTWFKLEVGDEVVTSGLDKIFFKGLKVGRVISITSAQGYQNAIVEPYYQSNDLNYFHIIKEINSSL